ncbi:hypothetical protein IPL68_07625 [Candidatus Saccharibacteria bacterium]|nr:MAG: hypothetical protein IPL68_07625 [Candidatus Saccharibacteria bacterium]
MGVGIEVDFSGSGYPGQDLDDLREHWMDRAVEEAHSVLARQGEPPLELLRAWVEVERLAGSSGWNGSKLAVYLLGQAVVFSEAAPVPSSTQRLTRLIWHLKVIPHQ